MKTDERRRHRRHKIGLHATLITASTTIPVYATDISVHGIHVTAPDPIVPETAVTLCLEGKEAIRLSGHVLWSLEELRRGKRGFELGIALTAIVRQEKRLIGFIDKASLLNEILEQADHS